jgi:hypothetical protein
METKIIKPSSEPRPGGFTDRSGQKEKPAPAKPEPKPKEKG